MSTPVETHRQHLRRDLRARRERLDAPTLVAAAGDIAKRLEALPAFLHAGDVAGYWAGRGEVPLNVAVTRMQRRGQRYWLPRVLAQRRLDFARWSSGDPVQANRFGIPEPGPQAQVLAATELDVVLVPLLGFDEYGNRLGMGGGFYDSNFAFLKQASRPARPLLVGIAHDFQQLPRLQPQSWDVRLDYVATPGKLVDCRADDPSA